MGKSSKKRNNSYRKANNRKMRAMNKQTLEPQKWESLNDLLGVIASQFAAYGQILELVRIPELLEEVENKTELNERLQNLSKDIAYCNDMIKEIVSQHSHRTGLVAEDDYNLYLLIGQQYFNLQAKIEELVVPEAISILTMLNVAEEKLKERIKQENLTNPEVVSDVEFVEKAEAVQE